MQFEQSLHQFEDKLRSSGPLVTDEQLRAILNINETDDTEEKVHRYNQVYADLMHQYEEMLQQSESMRSHRGDGRAELSGEQCKELKASHDRAVAAIRTECEELLKRHQRSLPGQRSTLPKGPRIFI
jgi:uncharacterized protein YicC (UPF0701 family)